MKRESWDIIISGAGPAGLTAGICCAEAGMGVVILEKGDKPGPFPRGETVHAHPVLEKMLGKGFISGISMHETAARRFNSPGAKKNFEIQRSTSSMVFEWERFIDRLRARAEAQGARLLFNREVTAPVMAGDRCTGARLANGEEYQGRTTLACDGHTSRLGRASGVAYGKINCPIVKGLASNFQGRYQGFEYFFVAHGELEYARDFPPAILYIFPRGREECEIGLMIFTGVWDRMKKVPAMPDEEEVLRVWHRLIESYPGFSRLLQGSRIDFEGVTAIPAAGMHHEAMSVPGLVLVGDSMGFVEASGASGIVASMESARLVADFLKNRSFDTWNRTLQAEFNRFFQASETHKHIKKLYRVIPPAMNLILGRLKTPENINRHWWLVRTLFRLS